MRVSTGSATHGLRRAGVDQRRITSRGGILEPAALAADARRRGRVDRAPRLLVRGDLLRALLVPERGRQDFRRDAAVLVLLRDVLDLLEERVVELGGLEAGFEPTKLNDALFEEVQDVTQKYKDRCIPTKILPASFWNKKRAQEVAADKEARGAVDSAAAAGVGR